MTRAEVMLAAAIAVVLAFHVWRIAVAWPECRSEGRSVAYCIALISK